MEGMKDLPAGLTCQLVCIAHGSILTFLSSLRKHGSCPCTCPHCTALFRDGGFVSEVHEQGIVTV